jgi:hypothetical protein
MRCRVYTTRRLNPQVCDMGRASALRLYPSRYISAAGSEDRALSLHTHTGLGLGGRSTRIASTRSLHRPCAGGRAGVRSHHWAGILAHADYGPALLRLSLTCRSADLGLPQAPRQCRAPGLVRFASLSERRPGPGSRRPVADLSERTRPPAVTTVRSGQVRPGILLGKNPGP